MQYQSFPPQQGQQPYTPQPQTYPGYQPPIQPDVAQPQQYPFPPYPQPGQFQQPPQTPPPQPPKRAWHQKIWGWCKLHPILSIIVVVVVVVLSAISSLSSPQTQTSTAPHTAAQPTQAVAQPTVIPTAIPTVAPTSTPTVAPTSTPTPAPTVKPVPTQSPAQEEQAYKARTTPTTVDNLDKDGATDQGKDVHFTGTIGNFVKDDSGNTAGANINTPDGSLSMAVIQVAFPVNTDLSKLNQGDTIEVWGLDDGVSSGQNAYGGTVQEVGITALYMTDTTTGYQANG